MHYLRFTLLIMVAVVFASCPAEPVTAEITYDNRSDFIVSEMSDDTAYRYGSTLAPGKRVTFPYAFPPYADSVGFDFSYTLNGQEFRCPDPETGRPAMLIRYDESKTVVIYKEYYEIR
jgi:hypothetical protein